MASQVKGLRLEKIYLSPTLRVSLNIPITSKLHYNSYKIRILTSQFLLSKRLLLKGSFLLVVLVSLLI